MSIRPYERPVPVTTKWQIVRAVRTDDGRVPIEQPDGSFRPARGQTDWARVDRMTEADLMRSPPTRTIPATTPSYWETTTPVWPRRKKQVTVLLDADMLVPPAGPRLPDPDQRRAARLLRGSPAGLRRAQNAEGLFFGLLTTLGPDPDVSRPALEASRDHSNRPPLHDARRLGREHRADERDVQTGGATQMSASRCEAPDPCWTEIETT
jgi:hypothetical protein